jgi:hypothetical protein
MVIKMTDDNERMAQENKDMMTRISGQAAPTDVDMMPIPTEEDITKRAQQDVDDFDSGNMQYPGRSEFEQGLEALINRHCMENISDTPDFILARYLRLQLDVFDATIRRREHWYGRKAGVMHRG